MIDAKFIISQGNITSFVDNYVLFIDKKNISTGNILVVVVVVVQRFVQAYR